MFKKILVILTCFVIITCNNAVLSESALIPNEAVFSIAKQALVLMSEKNYEQAILLLGAGTWLKAANLKTVIDKDYKHLYDTVIQEKYAVSWITGGKSYLAVPFEEPSDGTVDALVLTLEGGQAVRALAFAHWSDVEAEVNNSSQVKWCDEYRPSYRIFVD